MQKFKPNLIHYSYKITDVNQDIPNAKKTETETNSDNHRNRATYLA